MKNILIATLAVLMFTAALCATTIPGSPPNIAQTALTQGGYTPDPLCVASKLCGSDQVRLRAGEG